MRSVHMDSKDSMSPEGSKFYLGELSKLKPASYNKSVHISSSV